MITFAKSFLIFVVLFLSFASFAQAQVPAKKDTVKEFEIIRGPSMRSIHVDSATTLQTIAGGGVVKQGTTIFTADSIAINPLTHVVEAFGNVHINQADSTQTYSQYLKYIGTDKTAFLSKDVRLIDKKGTLFTQNLDYNLGTGIGNYHNGGRVVNGKTTITSNDGTYYADTKDLFFKNNVVETDAKNHMTADSLLYNMISQASDFYGNTNIKNKEVDIYTTQGTYDLKTGNALFTTRTTVKDSSGRVYIANNMALDQSSGNAQMEGNAIVKDSAGGYIVLANQIFLNKKINSFLATRKPVLIIKQDKDSIYIAADTIFSGFTTMVTSQTNLLKKDSVITDSLHKTTDSLNFIDTTNRYAAHDSLNFKPATDSIKQHKNETGKINLQQTKKPGIQNADTLKMPSAAHSKLPMIDSSRKNLKAGDSLNILKNEIQDKKNILLKDTVPLHDSLKISALKKNLAVIDTVFFKNKINNPVPLPFNKDSLPRPDSSRYFLAFHHVKIFTDSLQSVSDSLFFSAKDSIFRLYYDPVIWGNHTQITGDTIYLFTKNKKADRLYAFDRGMIVNKTRQGFYNQISGKTINGYFANGNIDYMRVRGSQAESVYYAQDSDSSYVGMNRATGDVIDLYFKNNDLLKVLYVNEISGKFYPMKKIPSDQKLLKGFIWLDDKRPKNKLELFE